MLSDLRKSFNRRHLTDPSYGFLFDEDASGEVVVLAVGASSFEPAQAELLEITAIVIQGSRLLTSSRLHLKVGEQVAQPRRRRWRCCDSPDHGLWWATT